MTEESWLHYSLKTSGSFEDKTTNERMAFNLAPPHTYSDDFKKYYKLGHERAKFIQTKLPNCTSMYKNSIFSNKQILLLILWYKEVQNIIQQDKHIYLTTVFHTDFVTNSIYKLDIVFPYTPHLEDHSDYHST
jgi:hypothetical protein